MVYNRVTTRKQLNKGTHTSAIELKIKQEGGPEVQKETKREQNRIEIKNESDSVVYLMGNSNDMMRNRFHENRPRSYQT